MLAFVFAALVIGVLVVIGINKIAENYVSDVYLEEDATIKRDKENIELFKEFVSKNGVASTDTEKISEFMNSKTYLYMIIYNQNNDTVIYESG